MEQNPKEQSTAKPKTEKRSIPRVFRKLSPAAKRRILHIISIAVLTLTSVLIEWDGINQVEQSYYTADQATYDSFYQTAFDFAESQNHVSNYVEISIEGAREVSRLEVLTVSGSEFVIKNPDENDKNISWLEVQGTGIFTVDLSAGEFIVDSDRHYVLVKVPRPMLTECSILGTGKQFWKNGRIIFNGSVAEGVQLSLSQLSEGRLKLEDSMKQSRSFHEAAENAAIRMIDSLVKKWNPNIPDLQVKVEFIEIGENF